MKKKIQNRTESAHIKTHRQPKRTSTEIHTYTPIHVKSTNEFILVDIAAHLLGSCRITQTFGSVVVIGASALSTFT